MFGHLALPVTFLTHAPAPCPDTVPEPWTTVEQRTESFLRTLREIHELPEVV